MKKRMLSLPLSAWFLLALCACGGGGAPTFDLHTETAYTHIDGLYVDTDYQDPEGQDRHMLYLFYTVYTPDQPLSVRSDATQLTVGEGETYSAEHYTGQCRLMPSYYYSSYLQDVSVGTPLAVVETFRIPAEVLTSGQAITLTNAQIPEMDQLILSTEDLVLCQGWRKWPRRRTPPGMTGSRLCAPRPIRKPPSRSAKRSMAALGTVTLTGSPIRLPFPSPATSPSPTRRKPSPGRMWWSRDTSPARSTAPAGWWRFPISGEEDGSIDLDLLSVFDQREG